MDGRRRIAEPVATRVARRLAAGIAPALERMAVRLRLDRMFGRARRLAWRWLAPDSDRRLPRGIGTVAFAALMTATFVVGVVRGGHVEAVLNELSDARDAIANAAGFRITSIALAGGKHLTREEILTTAGVTGRSSLLFLDATAARARLKANPWIAEATVLKLYPGRLHIKITEREAFALWQKDGKVAVMSRDGTVLEPFVSRRFLKLPLVVGAGADVKAKDFLAVIDGFPQIRDQVQASVLVADRRWNLHLKNGINVRLPEHDVEKALATLVALDRDKKLLSRDIDTVDLRLPDRVTVRLTEDAYHARAEALKPPKSKRKAGDA
jgi:cell division protein FtsQ